MKRKSKELKNESERQKRETRIDENDPEGLSETVEATKREGADLAAEAKETVREETKLIALELGISTDQAESLVDSVSDQIDAAKESDTLSELDIDGDGDTDMLSAVDPLVFEPDDSASGDQVVDPVGPTTDAEMEPGTARPVEADMTEPVDGEIEF